MYLLGAGSFCIINHRHHHQMFDGMFHPQYFNPKTRSQIGLTSYLPPALFWPSFAGSMLRFNVVGLTHATFLRTNHIYLTHNQYTLSPLPLYPHSCSSSKVSIKFCYTYYVITSLLFTLNRYWYIVVTHLPAMRCL